MTDFMYENRKQLEQIGRTYLARDIEMKVSKKNLNVFLYAIAYNILVERNINSKVYEKVKALAKKEKPLKEVLIFFEKVEYSKDDALYFQNVMKKIEKELNFKTEYEKYYKEVAAV